MIAIFSARVSLEDLLLRVARSLAAVPKPPPAPAPVSPASGSYSKAEATQVVERLHLGDADDPGVPNPAGAGALPAVLRPWKPARSPHRSRFRSCGRARRLGRLPPRWRRLAARAVARRRGSPRSHQFRHPGDDCSCSRPGERTLLPHRRDEVAHLALERRSVRGEPWKHTAGARAAGRAHGRAGTSETPSGNIVCLSPSGCRRGHLSCTDQERPRAPSRRTPRSARSAGLDRNADRIVPRRHGARGIGRLLGRYSAVRRGTPTARVSRVRHGMERRRDALRLRPTPG